MKTSKEQFEDERTESVANVIHVTIDDETSRRINKFCKENGGISRAAFTRAAVNSFLNKNHVK